MNNLKLSIIIPTLGREKYLLDTFADLIDKPTTLLKCLERLGGNIDLLKMGCEGGE